MKLPKGFYKHSDLAKREWVKLQLERVRRTEKQLLELSRQLSDDKFIPLEMDRPDLDEMKPGIDGNEIK